MSKEETPKKKKLNAREKALTDIKKKESVGKELSFGELVTKIGNAGKPLPKKK